MGVIKRGILGGFSGAVANVVGSTWKGIDYMKSLPLSVANPRTPGQVTQRNSFAGIVSIASNALSVIVKPLWDRFAVKESGYNSFVSANIKTMDGDTFAFPENLIISRGSLTGVENLQANVIAGNASAAVVWDDNSGDGNASATDEYFFMVLDVRKEVQEKKGSNIVRSDGNTPILFITPIPVGESYYLYVGIRKADGTLVCDSSYIELVHVP